MPRALVGVLVLGAAALAAAGVAWWLLADQPRAARSPIAPGTAPAPATGPAPTTPAPTTPVPSAPATPPTAPAPTTPGPTPAGTQAEVDSFDDEARDPTWAAEQEKELALRLRAVEETLEDRGLKVQIGAPTCRHHRCRVAVGAADTATLGRLFDALESEDGLRGWADSMLLERVEAGDDGRVESAVVAAFDRVP